MMIVPFLFRRTAQGAQGPGWDSVPARASNGEGILNHPHNGGGIGLPKGSRRITLPGIVGNFVRVSKETHTLDLFIGETNRVTPLPLIFFIIGIPGIIMTCKIHAIIRIC